MKILKDLQLRKFESGKEMVRKLKQTVVFDTEKLRRLEPDLNPETCCYWSAKIKKKIKKCKKKTLNI